MKNRRLTSFIAVLPIFLLLFAGECSRTTPELPRPNPPAPPAQTVVLTGYVLDAATGQGIANGTVYLTKLDGTQVSSTVTNGSGRYQFDLTGLNVTESQLIVVTNIASYGYGYRIASYNKSESTANVLNILLSKITSTVTVTVGATGGAASTPATTDAKTTTIPVTASIPPNAVPANTSVTLAAIPVKSTPPPTTSTASQNIVSTANLQATGVTTFSQPITLTFPLPMKLTAGSTIPLIKFNTSTNKWETTTINATVSTNGLSATAQVTSPGQYALLGNIGTTHTVSSGSVIDNELIGTTRLTKILKTQATVITLTSTKLTASYNGNTAPSYNVSLNSGDPALAATQAYTLGLLTQRYGVTWTATGNVVTFSFVYNLPLTLTSAGVTFNTTSDGTANGTQQGPPGHEGEAGDWQKKITISDQTVQDIFNVFQTGVWDNIVNLVEHQFSFTSQWYWQPHTQGSVAVGPY